MIRSFRSSLAPLLLLLGFEVGAIVVLQFLGAADHSMRVEWSNFGEWLSSNSIEQVVPPLVRVTALAVAWWMFLSTALMVVAQLSQIPAAINATAKFTLPAVRRLVDGAMVVTLATGAVVGTSSNAFAAEAGQPGDDGDAIATSHKDGHVIFTKATTAPSMEGQAAPSDPTTSTTAAPTTSTEAPTTTAVPVTTTTAAAPTTTAAPADPNVVHPKLQSRDGWVASPRPAGPRTDAPATPAPTAAPTPAPAPAPATPAPGEASGSGALGATEHTVVRGENLWSIARKALVDSGVSSPTEGQVRDYWLKVIDANKSTLRSHDPHWIFAGEVVKLPARS